MKLNLTNDLLLIRPLPDEDPVTAWGFVLPKTEDHVDTPLRGVVIAAGPGRRPKLSQAGEEIVKALEGLLKLETGHAPHSPTRVAASAALAGQNQSPARVPMEVKVGDTVIYSRHGFQAFRIAGEDLVVTQEASILGVFDRR